MKKVKKVAVGVFALLLTACAGVPPCYVGSGISMREDFINEAIIISAKEEAASEEVTENISEEAAGEREWSEEGAGYRRHYDHETFTYSYQILSMEGEIIEEGEGIPRMTYTEDISETMVHLVISAGPETIQNWFFDRETGEKSEVYFNVMAVNGTKIVYMDFTESGEICLVIRDIFDKYILYKEIIRDFSPTATACSDLREAVFLDDTTLEVEYLVGEEYDSVREIIKL